MGTKSKRLPFEELLGESASDRRLEVLRAIAQTGSISQAARVTGVSYKAAWQAVETLGNLAGLPLLEKVVGGAGGGGARLTAQGEDLLRAADLMRSVRRQALTRLQRSRQAGSVSAGTLAAVSLRTSMRNQWPCTVRAITIEPSMVRVTLSLSDGQTLIARITRESLELLGLRVGLSVLALCKATAVTIAPQIAALPGVNLIKGVVGRMAGGGASAREVTLKMDNGLSMVGLADAQGGLKRQQQALAALEESAVVIGWVA